MSELENRAIEPGANSAAAAPTALASVLVIDDEEIVGNTLSALLRAEGFDAVTALSGQDGVELLRGRQFDVAIADLVMPGVNGIQTITALKKVDPDVEVIILTGHATVDSAVEALRQGACDYLLKPIGIAQLRPALLRALDKRRPKAALPLYEASRALRATRHREDLIPAILTLAQRTLRASGAGLALLPLEGTGLRVNLSGHPEPFTEAAAERIAQIAMQAGEALRDLSFEAGNPVGMRGINHDITERKWAEEALRESEDRYRDLVENSFVLIGTHDAQGGILSLNRAAAQLLEGASAEELVGRPLTDYVPRNLLPQFNQYLQTVLHQGHAEGLMVIATPSGKRKIVEYRNTLRNQDPNKPIVRWVGQDVTERIQAEKAQAFLASLVESSQDAIIGKTLEGTIVSWNRGAEKLYGFGAEDVVGKSISILAPPDRTEELAPLLEKVRRGEPISRYETVRVRKDGRLVDVSLTISPVRDAAQIITGVVTIARDITERKRAEEALRESEEKYRVLYESSRDAIMLSAPPEWRFTAGNPAAITLFGARDEQEFVAAAPWSLSPEYQPDGELSSVKAHQMIDAAIERGSNFFEWTHKKLSGEEFLATVTLTRMTCRGKLLLQGTVRDITEHKQAEQQTRLQTAALESAANGIAIADREGRILWVNPAFTHLTGYAVEEILGQTMRILNSGEQSAGFYRNLWQTILAGEVWKGELVNRRKDGTRYTDDSTITPVRDANGTLTHFVAIKQDVTERRRAEQALQERTVYLNTLFEISPLGIVVLDTDGRIQLSNSAFEKLFRYSRQDIMGVKLDDFIVPSELASEAKTLTALCLGGGGAQTATSRRRKDRTLVDVEIYGVPIIIEGELRGVLALYQDITERMRAETDLVKYAEDLEVSKAAQEEHAQELAHLVEELAQERDLLGTVMDNVPDSVYYKDRQSRFLRINAAAARTLGLSDPRQAVGKTDFDFFPEEDAEAYFSDEQRVIETGQPLIGRIEKVRQPDGPYRWYSTSTVPIRDAQGRVTGLVGISRDITERMQAEETLRASEERYRELFENASDIVYTTGLDTRITSLNRMGQQILGYSAEEATQIDLRQVVAPKHWNMIERSRKRLWSGDSDLTFEVEVACKDGRLLTLEVKPRLIYRGGKPVGVQGIGRDISGRDAAEMELRNAQKLESVGRLAAGIAHEINTPIQFVGDNTRFLQDSFGGLQTLLSKYQELRDAADSSAVSPKILAEVREVEEASDCAYLLEEIPKALAQTLDGVTRVTTIVRAMKEFAHPTANAMSGADLNRALLSTLTVARNELKYVADVETEFGDLPLVICNIGDLNQVFLNLLVNAAHAIGEAVKGTGQKGTIRVRTVAQGSTVLVAISDTGCGIPEANHAKVFDPFFTTKEVGRGTGQGLAIARTVVVERHKGSLTFESELGKGTTFYVRLPVDPGECSKETRVP